MGEAGATSGYPHPTCAAPGGASARAEAKPPTCPLHAMYGTATPHGWLPRKYSMGQVAEQIPMGSMTRGGFATQRSAHKRHVERAQRSAASACWVDCSVQAERRGSGLCFPITFLLLLQIAGVQHSIMHLQETFSDVVKTDKTGLSKTAHTRWMISAFANFLPGSTIFRLA